MRTYRYKVQTNTFALFVGLAAVVLRSDERPTIGEQVSNRIWLDTSQVTDTFRNAPLTLNDREIGWLRFGLEKVAGSIERIEARNVRIAVRSLEIVEVDYAEAALAPALAGWAASEYGLPTPQGRTTLDSATGQRNFAWDA